MASERLHRLLRLLGIEIIRSPMWTVRPKRTQSEHCGYLLAVMED
jgi:hypothetical protein